MPKSTASPEQRLSLDRIIEDMTTEELLAALLLGRASIHIDHLTQIISVEPEVDTVAWYFAERIVVSFGDRIRPALIKSKLMLELVELLNADGRLAK